jgi:hypothetical protein
MSDPRSSRPVRRLTETLAKEAQRLQGEPPHVVAKRLGIRERDVLDVWAKRRFPASELLSKQGELDFGSA